MRIRIKGKKRSKTVKNGEMGMDMEKWMEENPPRPSGKGPGGQSPINKHKEEIFVLLKKGYTHKQICNYLEKNGILTKQSNLSRWIKRHWTSTEDRT